MNLQSVKQKLKMMGWDKPRIIKICATFWWFCYFTAAIFQIFIIWIYTCIYFILIYYNSLNPLTFPCSALLPSLNWCIVLGSSQNAPSFRIYITLIWWPGKNQIWDWCNQTAIFDANQLEKVSQITQTGTNEFKRILLWFSVVNDCSAAGFHCSRLLLESLLL